MSESDEEEEETVPFSSQRWNPSSDPTPDYEPSGDPSKVPPVPPETAAKFAQRRSDQQKQIDAYADSVMVELQKSVSPPPSQQQQQYESEQQEQQEAEPDTDYDTDDDIITETRTIGAPQSLGVNMSIQPTQNDSKPTITEMTGKQYVADITGQEVTPDPPSDMPIDLTPMIQWDPTGNEPQPEIHQEAPSMSMRIKAENKRTHKTKIQQHIETKKQQTPDDVQQIIDTVRNWTGMSQENWKHVKIGYKRMDLDKKTILTVYYDSLRIQLQDDLHTIENRHKTNLMTDADAYAKIRELARQFKLDQDDADEVVSKRVGALYDIHRNRPKRGTPLIKRIDDHNRALQEQQKRLDIQKKQQQIQQQQQQIQQQQQQQQIQQQQQQALQQEISAIPSTEQRVARMVANNPNRDNIPVTNTLASADPLTADKTVHKKVSGSKREPKKEPLMTEISKEFPVPAHKKMKLFTETYQPDPEPEPKPEPTKPPNKGPGVTKLEKLVVPIGVTKPSAHKKQKTTIDTRGFDETIHKKIEPISTIIPPVPTVQELEEKEDIDVPPAKKLYDLATHWTSSHLAGSKINTGLMLAIVADIKTWPQFVIDDRDWYTNSIEWKLESIRAFWTWMFKRKIENWKAPTVITSTWRRRDFTSMTLLEVERSYAEYLKYLIHYQRAPQVYMLKRMYSKYSK